MTMAQLGGSPLLLYQSSNNECNNKSIITLEQDNARAHLCPDLKPRTAVPRISNKPVSRRQRSNSNSRQTAASPNSSRIRARQKTPPVLTIPPLFDNNSKDGNNNNKQEQQRQNAAQPVRRISLEDVQLNEGEKQFLAEALAAVSTPPSSPTSLQPQQRQKLVQDTCPTLIKPERQPTLEELSLAAPPVVGGGGGGAAGLSLLQAYNNKNAATTTGKAAKQAQQQPSTAGLPSRVELTRDLSGLLEGV